MRNPTKKKSKVFGPVYTYTQVWSAHLSLIKSTIQLDKCMKLVVNLIVYGSKIIQMNFYNFDKFRPIDTFCSITKINIPLKVPHLFALSWVT